MMRDILLGLSLTPGIGWQTIHKLILAGIDTHVFHFTVREWLKEYPFLSMKQVEGLTEWLVEDKLNEYKANLAKRHIEYVTVVDSCYPPLLKEISFAPWILFVKGNPALLSTPTLAVVGSRKATHYGRMATEKLVTELVKAGWGITSGLALGIDAIAHQATIAAQGIGIGVLGCGIDQIYPAQNKHLYHNLAKQGLLVSEYPPGTKAHPGFFPQRNRIIAGLSYGVIVVEAAKKSGSLITAQIALEHGREVFAVPGSIFSQQSVGTNLLIQQQGAKLITHHQDVLEEFSHINLPRSGSVKFSNLSQPKETLGQEEEQIISALSKGKKHVNELLSVTKLPFSTLTKVLLKLELKGEIKQLPGSYYLLSNYPTGKPFEKNDLV